MRARTPATICTLVLSACATGKPEGPSPLAWEQLFPSIVDQAPSTDGLRGSYRVREPDSEQRAALGVALRLYVAGDDEEFSAAAVELAKDPVAAYWTAHLLNQFVIKARDAFTRRAHRTPPVGEPVWDRPIRHLRTMGIAAVPAVVIDLLRSPYSERVELGRELLVELGPDAYPAWSGIYHITDTRGRRRTMDVLSEWEEHTPAMLKLLQRGAQDEDFGVRAAAYRGLARSASLVPVIVAALSSDGDPFVEREIVKSLGGHRTREAAEALLAYMERTVEAGDHRGTVAADEALRKMSGRERPGNLRTWRGWVSTVRD